MGQSGHRVTQVSVRPLRQLNNRPEGQADRVAFGAFREPHSVSHRLTSPPNNLRQARHPLPYRKKMAESLVKPKTMHTFAAQSESSAVGSALRSGRRGRAFESPLSDRAGAVLTDCSSFFCTRRKCKGESYQPSLALSVALSFVLSVPLTLAHSNGLMPVNLWKLR